MVRLASHEWQPSDAHEAPLCLLVHGVTGWWRTWWRVGPALADAGWHVVAVDQRGHGHSPRIDGTVTVRDLAEDLAAKIELIGMPVDLLVGHSLGGAVAADLAIARPEIAGRVVLEDPPAVVRDGDEEWLARQEAEIEAARRGPDGETRRTLERNPSWLEEDARQDVEGKALADGAGIVASFRAGIGARALELLPRLTMPGLLLLADEVRSVFTPPARRQLAGTLPPTVRQITFDAGHTIHRDRFEDYVATILDWAGRPVARRSSPERMDPWIG